MNRTEQRDDEMRRDPRSRNARSWADRGQDSDRDRERFERDDWRDDPGDDPGTDGDDERRRERSFRRFGELEEWQQPRQYGRDEDRGSHSDLGSRFGDDFRQDGRGRFGRSGWERSRRVEWGGRDFGRDDSSDRSEPSFDPRPRESDRRSGGSSEKGAGFRSSGRFGSLGPSSGRRDSQAFGRGYGQQDDVGQLPSFSGKGPKGYQRSDERIREDICDGLTQDPHIDAQGISITVRQGEVTLEGTVPNRQMKRAAEDLAEQVMGVGEVTNTIRIQRASSHSGPEGADASEGEKSKRTGASGTGSGGSAKSTTGRIG